MRARNLISVHNIFVGLFLDFSVAWRLVVDIWSTFSICDGDETMRDGDTTGRVRSKLPKSLFIEYIRCKSMSQLPASITPVDPPSVLRSLVWQTPSAGFGGDGWLSLWGKECIIGKPWMENSRDLFITIIDIDLRAVIGVRLFGRLA